MYLEYDWTSNVYRARFGDVFVSINGWYSFPTMQDARWELNSRGLVVGKKTDSRTWEIKVKQDA